MGAIPLNISDVMTLSDYIAIGVLIVLIPVFMRRTFGRRKSGPEQNKENKKE
jgi:hypothetical protein